MLDYPMSLISMSTWSIFWLGEPRGSFWDTFTFCTFLPEHSFMLKSYGWWGGVGGGPCDFSVSPWSKSFFFLFLGDFYSTLGPVGTGARTWTWTRAWQFRVSPLHTSTQNTISCVFMFFISTYMSFLSGYALQVLSWSPMLPFDIKVG